MLNAEDVLFPEDETSLFRQIVESPPLSWENSWKILIVDDEEDVHYVTCMALRSLAFDGRGVEFLSGFSAADAKELLREHPEVAVILLDVVMENENAGLNLVQYIRNELKNTMIRIILRTGHPGQAPEENVTLEYDINDYREKSELTAQSLRTAVVTALRSYRDLSTIDGLSREIDANQKELIYILGEIAESRSFETGNHVKRVGEIAKFLAIKHGLSEHEAELLKLAASMHDIGKLAIHDSILNKPGKLTPEEFSVMKTHSQLGCQMLQSSNRPLFKMATIIAKEHHENYDGTGYPAGLKAEDIHIYSRIVALADVFDALGNRRVYKDPWTQDRILEYVKSEAGKKFDPHLVTLFFTHIREITMVREMLPDIQESALSY
jgi:response regulator RpfG family c-di-GMP phosphodiesterase